MIPFLRTTFHISYYLCDCDKNSTRQQQFKGGSVAWAHGLRPHSVKVGESQGWKLEKAGHLASCSQETFSFLCSMGPEAREWCGPLLCGLLISVGTLKGQAEADNTVQAPIQANLI